MYCLRITIINNLKLRHVELKNYIIVDEGNQWLATLVDVTIADLKNEAKEIEAAGRNDGNMFAYEVNAEPINL